MEKGLYSRLFRLITKRTLDMLTSYSTGFGERASFTASLPYGADHGANRPCCQFARHRAPLALARFIAQGRLVVHLDRFGADCRGGYSVCRRQQHEVDCSGPAEMDPP